MTAKMQVHRADVFVVRREQPSTNAIRRMVVVVVACAVVVPIVRTL